MVRVSQTSSRRPSFHLSFFIPSDHNASYRRDSVSSLRLLVSICLTRLSSSFSLFYPPPPPPTTTMTFRMRRYNRTATTLITLFGAVINAILTIQVLAAWRSFKWEQESEWEASGDKWQLDGIRFIWGLLFVYFASAASVCAVGLHGVLKVRGPNTC